MSGGNWCHQIIFYKKWFEDTKGVISSHKSKKERQYNLQKKQKDLNIQTLQRNAVRKMGVNTGAPEW